MTENLDAVLAEVLARIPVDPRFPVDALRVRHASGLSPAQKTFLILHGDKFTASEAALVFSRSPQSIEENCRRLGVVLIKGSRGVKVGTVRQEDARRLAQQSLAAAAAPKAALGPITAPVHEYSGAWSTARAEAVQARPYRSAALRAYKPLRVDLDAGWVVNEWILHKMGLKRLGADGCSFIAGDPSVPDWTYCGKKRGHGCGVYCEPHALRCRSAQQPQGVENGGKTEEGPGTSAGVDDKGKVQHDHAGARGPAQRGGRRVGRGNEGIQDPKKAGHKPRRAQAGAQA